MESRELKRKEGLLYLGDTEIRVSSPLKPRYISLYNGRNNLIRFKTEEEIRERLIPLAEQLCDSLNAACYELGEKLVTWSSDPGFGARTEHYIIQFYQEMVDWRGLLARRENAEWWQRRIDEDNRWMSREMDKLRR